MSSIMLYLFLLSSANKENICIVLSQQEKKLMDAVGAACDVVYSKERKRFPATSEAKLRIPGVRGAPVFGLRVHRSLHD